MTLSFGNYDESYPPEVLRGYVAPVLAGAARRPDTEGESPVSEPTTPPPEVDAESNSPEGAVPVDATRTEPDGPVVVAVPLDQLDEEAANPPPAEEGEAESTPTVRAATVREVAEPDEPTGEDRARFTVTAGTPGTYEPDVSARDRPRNVTELRAFARPATREPWAVDEYVLVGTTGKRAHWTGDDWRGDESPGYGVSDDSLDDEPDENPDDDEPEPRTGPGSSTATGAHTETP